MSTTRVLYLIGFCLVLLGSLVILTSLSLFFQPELVYALGSTFIVAGLGCIFAGGMTARKRSGNQQ